MGQVSTVVFCEPFNKSFVVAMKQEYDKIKLYISDRFLEEGIVGTIHGNCFGSEDNFSRQECTILRNVPQEFNYINLHINVDLIKKEIKKITRTELDLLKEELAKMTKERNDLQDRVTHYEAYNEILRAL